MCETKRTPIYENIVMVLCEYNVLRRRHHYIHQTD